MRLFTYHPIFSLNTFLFTSLNEIKLAKNKDKTKMHTILKLILLLILTLSSHAKIIKDRAGNDIEVPQNIQKAFGLFPPMNYLIYTLNSEKMIGLNFSPKKLNSAVDEVYLNKKFLSLPVIGVFYGAGQNINLETLINLNPDLILIWEDDVLIDKVQKEIAKTKIATITLPFRKIEDIPFSIAFAGEAIDEKERGDILASYAQNIIDEIKGSLSNTKPTKYYYASGDDGLSTVCSVSFHVEALNFAGGENVYQCDRGGKLGSEKISIEVLLSFDPDIIVVQGMVAYNNIMKNPIWQHLRAVKAKNVHLVPDNPFNWIDRPPSFMQIIGIQWLSKLFHPEVYNIDFVKRVKEFYSLYLNVEISDKQVKQLIGEKNE